MPSKAASRLCLIGLVVALLANGGGPSYAADAQTTDSTANSEGASGSSGNDPESTREETTNKPAEAAKNESVFRPSEDISEDLAVPFPVDI